MLRIQASNVAIPFAWKVNRERFRNDWVKAQRETRGKRKGFVEIARTGKRERKGFVEIAKTGERGRGYAFDAKRRLRARRLNLKQKLRVRLRVNLAV